MSEKIYNNQMDISSPNSQNQLQNQFQNHVIHLQLGQLILLKII